jgi:REP element-mobilizing transposase RayT
MARPPRILLPRTVVFVTSRIQQGIPFVGNALLNLIVWSALALAYQQHPVRIIGFIVMGNHIHMLILVEDPTTLESFMERFKCETAHAVNRLLGRRQVTVWCEGYHAPAVLTIPDLIDKLAYLYTNPATAQICNSIEEYHGVSSWTMFNTTAVEKTVTRVRRTDVPHIGSSKLSPIMYQQLASDIRARAKENLKFTLDPNAWRTAFPDGPSIEDFNLQVKERIRSIESDLAQKKDDSEPPTIHKTTERETFINTTYLPKKFTPQMWCICRCISLRKQFISFVKYLRTLRRKVREEWIRGNRDAPCTPGLFPPNIPIRANLIPPYSPIEGRQAI